MYSELMRQAVKYLPLILLLLPLTCMADEQSCKAARAAPSADHSWHLLTITEGGTVTLLKDLTRKEAEFARARALGTNATVEECDRADKEAAQEKRYYEAKAKIDEGILRAKAPKCPAGETQDKQAEASIRKAWVKQHEKDITVILSPDRTCGVSAQVDACLLSDGSVKRFEEWSAMEASCNATWRSITPSDIKSAEVFR